MELHGRRVTVMGLGRHGGGVAAVRYAARSGAAVTVTDLASESELAQPLAELTQPLVELADLPNVRFALGGHAEQDFRQADVVIVNPAVRPGDSFVALARAAGALITSEIELFLRACPARIVGVTGSNGKSTTASLLAAMLAESGKKVWLGGNIGRSLLGNIGKGEIGQIETGDYVVLELSSFQLAQLADGESIPAALRTISVGVVGNCAPNHLDWHGSFADYRAAKQRLLDCIFRSGIAVLNDFDPDLATWPRPAAPTIGPLADALLPPLLLPGQHNRLNARCAAAAAQALGCSLEAIAAAAAKFAGLPHRLEFAGKIAARTFINDSKATTPEAVIAALNTFQQPVWLLAGGQSKGTEFTQLAAQIVQRAYGVCFFGAAREELRAAVELQRLQLTNGVLPAERINTTETLAEGVAWCFAHSQPGDAIVLSPACASFDQYRDYAHRAENFFAAIAALDENSRGAMRDDAHARDANSVEARRNPLASFPNGG